MKNIICTSTKKNAVAGFTLIEVLIAISIFSIGILATGTMMIRSTSVNTAAGTISNAAEGASNRVEILLCSVYNHPDLNVGAHTPVITADGLDNDYDGQIDEVGETGNLAISWTVAEIIPDAFTDVYNYKTVTVTVSWTQGMARTVVIQRNIPIVV